MEEQLNQLYLKLLNRSIDKSGLKTYINVLKNNDIKYVENIIKNSKEYKNITKETISKDTKNVTMKQLQEKLIFQKYECFNLNSNFTVLITNWKRLSFLKKCLNSVILNKIQNIVISVCECDSLEHIEFLQNISTIYPFIKVTFTKTDNGCNNLWLNGLYNVHTDYVLILHDDDELHNTFYHQICKIEECLNKNACMILWDGQILENNKILDEIHNSVPNTIKNSDIIDPNIFLNHYKKCVYPLSPVVQILKTKICIEALNECKTYFTDSKNFTKPTMMIGNEINMTIRNLEYDFNTGHQMLYINKPLTCYGRHPESESEIYVQNGSNQLKDAYIFSRKCIENKKSHYNPNIIHVVNIFEPKSDNDKRRHLFASSTWQTLYETNKFIPMHIYDAEFNRNSSHVGDKLKLPFIKDIINYACKYSTDNDIICLTNADICITNDSPEKIINHIKKYECGFSFRYDKHSQLNEEYSSKEVINKLQWYVGSDLFVFTKKWWNTHKNMFPDFIIGKPCWDWIMRCLMGYSIEKEKTFQNNLDNHGLIASIEGIAYHEKHESYAEKSDIYLKDKANLYNWYLAKQWFDKYTTKTIDGYNIFDNINFNNISDWCVK